MSRDPANAGERLRCLGAEHVDPILGFAMRRADQADDTQTSSRRPPGRLATDRRGAGQG